MFKSFAKLRNSPISRRRIAPFDRRSQSQPYGDKRECDLRGEVLAHFSSAGFYVVEVQTELVNARDGSIARCQQKRCWPGKERLCRRAVKI